jgi:2-dehydropantoate 2-reductase
VTAERIVIAGAGSIGCYIGGALALSGANVTVLARPWLVDRIRAHGIRVTDLEGRDRRVAPSTLRVETEAAAAFRQASLILVTVKSGDTAEMTDLIAGHAPPDAAVLSLQNGVDNLPLLRARLGPTRVIAGMVPFNVAQTQREGEAPLFHRATSGKVVIDAGHDELRRLLDAAGLGCVIHPDMASLAWSKLALNMNNALNALSGLQLRQQLSMRPWRLILADQISELLDVTHRAGLKLPPIEGVRPAMIPFILRLPDVLFRIVARSMLAIDPQATSSMAEDIGRGRETEVQYLQGAVVRLAASTGSPAPISAKIVTAVQDLEQTGKHWTATNLAAHIGAPKQSLS